MLTLIQLAAMVAVAVQIIKTYTDQNILKPTNPVHDNSVRLLSIVLGILFLAANQRGVALDSAAMLKVVYEGGLVGGGSILGYHGAKGILPSLITGPKVVLPVLETVPAEVIPALTTGN
jgi:hypothetical protein